MSTVTVSCTILTIERGTKFYINPLLKTITTICLSTLREDYAIEAGIVNNSKKSISQFQMKLSFDSVWIETLLILKYIVLLYEFRRLLLHKLYQTNTNASICTEMLVAITEPQKVKNYYLWPRNVTKTVIYIAKRGKLTKKCFVVEQIFRWKVELSLGDVYFSTRQLRYTIDSLLENKSGR